MTRVTLLLAALVLGACSDRKSTEATQSTVVVFEPDAAPRLIETRQFVVTPEAVQPGQAAMVRVELAGHDPSRQIAVEWYAPDGWLLAYDVHPAERTFTVAVPVRVFGTSGPHRAVLRSEGIVLAEAEILFAK